MTRIWKGEKLSFWFHTSHSIRNKSHSSQFQRLCLTKSSSKPRSYFIQQKFKICNPVLLFVLLFLKSGLVRQCFMASGCKIIQNGGTLKFDYKTIGLRTSCKMQKKHNQQHILTYLQTLFVFMFKHQNYCDTYHITSNLFPLIFVTLSTMFIVHKIFSMTAFAFAKLKLLQSQH